MTRLSLVLSVLLVLAGLPSAPAQVSNRFNVADLEAWAKRGDADAQFEYALRLLTVRGTQIPRMAAKVERLRTQLSQTKYRQEVECEFIADGQAYFDLSVIEAATSKTEAAIVPKF